MRDGAGDSSMMPPHELFFSISLAARGIEIPNSIFILFDVGFKLMEEDNNVNPLRLLGYAVVSMPLPRI
ncbi:hypothetical protein TanjilG_09886 [Lupinus angustifolius]|uniref:Uncharacterized protein n=1 Tax=Lupinus angustifolius TaxID=3871 RepID=A0A1J7HCQ2_LUPAN|nr:hypothetical protein TanjilG_09886 [Lupinus angustifolius]